MPSILHPPDAFFLQGVLMSGPSHDPLYRSDARTTGGNGQQADLAAVSSQPSEHWTQQAQQREAAEPAAPTDPMGAQPQPDSGEPGGSRASPENGAQATSTPAAAAAPTAALVSSSPAAAPAESAESNSDSAGSATVGHDATLTMGGEMAWSDPGGDHIRSGEVSMDISQVASSAGATAAMAEAGDGSPITQMGVPGPADTVVQTALTQASTETSSGVALVQDLMSSQALTEAPDLLPMIQTVLDPALEMAGSLTREAGSLTDAALGETVSPTTDVIDDLTLDAFSQGASMATVVEAVSATETLVEAIDDPLEEIANPLVDDIAAPSSAGSSGFLASLFTPQDDADPAAPAPGPGHAGLDDILPDLHLGGLTDDFPDSGLGL